MNVILHPLSRFLVALIFLMSGVGKIFNFAGTSEGMAKVGFPMPDLFLVGAIVFELVGGLLLLIGYKARIAAVILIVFIIPATLIYHVPNMADRAEMIAVLKNLAIIGALIKFLADGAGAFSVDEKGE